jgi:two-component sensor histidine kinase
MALHELAMNAAKYGAPSTPAGQVQVGWKVVLGESGMRHLRLEWVEAGGPPVVVSKHRAFGTRLISMCIGRELGGVAHIDFAPEGLRCTIEVPMDDTAGIMVSPPLVQCRAIPDPGAAD